MAYIDEFADLLSPKTRLNPVAPYGQPLDSIILQLQASAAAAATLQHDPALPAHLKPQVADFTAAVQVALAQLAGRR